MKRPIPSETLAVIAIFAVALIVLALTPAVMLLDRGADRDRSMYLDMETMAKLQYLQFQETGRGTATVLGAGESVVVDGHEFTPSPGVTMEVKVSTTRYCIRGHNQYGHTSMWNCQSAKTDPGGSMDMLGS